MAMEMLMVPTLLEVGKSQLDGLRRKRLHSESSLHRRMYGALVLLCGK
jgi:hypothetical protein